MRWSGRSAPDDFVAGQPSDVSVQEPRCPTSGNDFDGQQRSREPSAGPSSAKVTYRCARHGLESLENILGRSWRLAAELSVVECMFDCVMGLAQLPPGVELAAALAAIDLPTVPNHLMIEVLRAHARQSAHHQGLLLAALAEVGCTVALEDLPDGVNTARSEELLASASGEIAAALTLTQRRADNELALADTVVRGLPRVFAALLAGEIDRAKAWVFADHLAPETCGLSRAQIDAVCARLVPLAPGWTTGQLAARLWRAVLAIDPDHARRRYDRAVRERGVVGYLAPDGTVTISGSGLGVGEAVAACERLERLARAVKRAGHPGLLGQIQADLYVGMLDGRWQHATEQEIIADLLGEAPVAEAPPVEAPAAPAGSARSRTTRPASARPTVTPVATRPVSA
ncbi:MAG: 13E12 repeat family protein, partial [Actinomycetota bacterium]|nr:13E12 repeat family protein [Actinomycetota bacterium]